jgi:hypothetical protein
MPREIGSMMSRGLYHSAQRDERQDVFRGCAGDQGTSAPEHRVCPGAPASLLTLEALQSFEAEPFCAIGAGRPGRQATSECEVTQRVRGAAKRNDGRVLISTLAAMYGLDADARSSNVLATSTAVLGAGFRVS